MKPRRRSRPRLVLLDANDEPVETPDSELSLIEAFLGDELKGDDAEDVSRRLLEDDRFYHRVEEVIEDLELPEYTWQRLARAMREARAA